MLDNSFIKTLQNKLVVENVPFPFILTKWFGNRISISHTKAKKKNMETIYQQSSP